MSRFLRTSILSRCQALLMNWCIADVTSTTIKVEKPADRTCHELTMMNLELYRNRQSRFLRDLFGFDFRQQYLGELSRFLRIFAFRPSPVVRLNLSFWCIADASSTTTKIVGAVPRLLQRAFIPARFSHNMRFESTPPLHGEDE